MGKFKFNVLYHGSYVIEIKCLSILFKEKSFSLLDKKYNECSSKKIIYFKCFIWIIQ